MRFEVTLPGFSGVFALRLAGLETGDYTQRLIDLRTVGPLDPPIDVATSCLACERPVPVILRILAIVPQQGRVKSGPRLCVIVEDQVIGRRLQDRLMRYSYDRGGDAAVEKERTGTRIRLDRALARFGIELAKPTGRLARLTPEAFQTLRTLFEQTDHPDRELLLQHFNKQSVPDALREPVARWLVDRFPIERDPLIRWRIGERLGELAVRHVGDDLVRLLKNNGFGASRMGLCTALASLKHPQAADVFAFLLDDETVAGPALVSLGKIKAANHIERVRPLLEHKNAGLRREARKVLAKLGAPAGIPPKPPHGVRAKPPTTLAEWSVNLDMDDLEPMLGRLSSLVGSGFATREIAEVVDVAERMAVDQSRRFKFPLPDGGDLWVEIFMDDVDSPDLAVRAAPTIIESVRRGIELE